MMRAYRNHAHRWLCSTLLVLIGPLLTSASKKPSTKAPKPALSAKAKSEKDLYEDKSVEEIARTTMFVGDFNQKDEVRKQGKEVFWRYPVTMPKVGFGLAYTKAEDFKTEGFKADFPVTPGAGRAIEHMNSGRVLFLDGDIEEARKIWLGGQARYKSSYPYHRRAEYFISQAFFYKGLKLWEQRGQNFDDPDVRANFGSSTKFLTRAIDERKEGLSDPLLEQIAPRAYYNLAALYYNYKRWAGVVGATSMGLEFLKEKGRTEYRRDLRLMSSEIFIMNHDYLEAFRELDLTMRQHPDLETASHAFSRIGDIYFDLNNFELAEEVYSLGSRIDKKINKVRPLQYVLRGESLFWLGRYAEARQLMEYALQANNFPGRLETLRTPQEKEPEIEKQRAIPYAVNDLDLHMEALASMRIADSLLAEKSYEKAKLAYFKHSTQFRTHETAAYAELRLACLELPEYEGNNIRHARELLTKLMKDPRIVQHPAAVEMGATCEMASYAQHERTPEMVDRVRKFAVQYPNSDFLKSLVDPVREVQAHNIEPFFEAGDSYGAIDFFEKTRATLYPKVSEDLAKKLFVSYVDTNHSEKSAEFLPAYERGSLDAKSQLRLAVALVELSEHAEGKKLKEYQTKSQDIAGKIAKQIEVYKPEDWVKLYLNRILESKSAELHYPWIMALALSWGEKDISTACDMVYPLLEKSRKVRVSMGHDAEAEAFIQKNLMDMLRFETNCAYSLMEYELGLFKGRMSKLADLYQQRSYVPLNGTTSNILWNIAEGCRQEGAKESAQRLWTYLVEKGTPDLPEVRFAKARLDGRRTEFEDLWGK